MAAAESPTVDHTAGDAVTAALQQQQFLHTLQQFPQQIRQLQERFGKARPFLALMGHEASALTAGLKQADRMTRQRSLVVELQDHLQPEVPDTPENDEAAAGRLPLIYQSQEMLGSAEACLAALQVMVDSCRAVLAAGQKEVATYRTLVAAARHNTGHALQFALARSHRHHNTTTSALLQLPTDVLKAIAARAGPACRSLCWGMRTAHDHGTTTLALRPDPRPPAAGRHPAGPALYVLRTWPTPQLVTAAHSTCGLPTDVNTAILARLPALRSLTISAPLAPDVRNPLDTQIWALASASDPPPPPLTNLRILTPARVAWEVVAPWAPSLAALTLAPYGNPATLAAFTALTALTVTGTDTFTRQHVRQDSFWAALPCLPRLRRLAVAADLAWGSAVAHAAAPLLTALTHLDTTLRAPHFGPAVAHTPQPPEHPPHSPPHDAPHPTDDTDAPASDPDAAIPPPDAPGPLIVVACVRRLPALASLHLRGAATLLPLPPANQARIARQLVHPPLTHLRLSGTGPCEPGALGALNLGVLPTLQDLAVIWTDHTAPPLSAATLLPQPHPTLKTLTLHLDGLQLAPTLHHTHHTLPALTHLHFLAGPASAAPPSAAPPQTPALATIAAPAALHPPTATGPAPDDATAWATHTAHASIALGPGEQQPTAAAAAAPVGPLGATLQVSGVPLSSQPLGPATSTTNGPTAAPPSPTSPLDALPHLVQPQLPLAQPTPRTSFTTLPYPLPASPPAAPPTGHPAHHHHHHHHHHSHPFANPASHAPAGQNPASHTPAGHPATHPASADASQAAPSLLQLLTHVRHAVSVDLTRCYATPRDIAALMALPTLHELRLGRIDFHTRLDRCLAAVARLRSLQVLNLQECRAAIDTPTLQHLLVPHAACTLRELVLPDAAAVRTATAVLGRCVDVVRAPSPAEPLENV